MMSPYVDEPEDDAQPDHEAADNTWPEDDPEGPLPEDVVDDDDDETPTVPCPNCKAEIPDLADKCPYCGEWVAQSAGNSAPVNWFIVAAVLALLVFLLVNAF